MGEKGHGETEGEPLKEFSYEEGVLEILRLIKERFQNNDLVVVGVMGRGRNVGRTTLTKDLRNELEKIQIPAAIFKALSESDRKDAEDTLAIERRALKKKQNVLIIDDFQMGAFTTHDRETAEETKQWYLKRLAVEAAGSPCGKILVGMSDSTHPAVSADSFSTADVLIKNEHAKKKKEGIYFWSKKKHYFFI